MFFLLLITILAVVGAGLGDPTIGLEAASASFHSGSAVRGGFGYGNNRDYGYSYGSPYGYHPQLNINNRYEGWSSVYTPGRLNPTIYQSSYPSAYYPQIGPFLRNSYRNRFTPQRSCLKSYQIHNNPTDSMLIPETLIPTTTSALYYSVPYLESVEVYKVYNNISKAFVRKKIDNEFDFDSNIKKDYDNENTIGLQEPDTITSDGFSREDTHKKAEPVLQLTYLGYVPQSSFRSALPSITADESKRNIPFYILDYDDETPGMLRSSFSSPPVFISPVKLRSATRLYPSRSTVRPAWSPYSSVTQVLPERGLSQHIPIVSRHIPEVSQSQRLASQDDQSGYYLIDVKPVPRDPDPIVGAPQPTLFSLIQTLTGPIGGPIQGGLGPTSTGPNTNTQSQTGREIEKKVEKLSYKPVYDIPVIPTHNTYQSNGQTPAKRYDGIEQQVPNSGIGQIFGIRDFEDNLVRNLIAVRNKPEQKH